LYREERAVGYVAYGLSWALRSAVRSLTLVRQADAAAYYTLLGDDVIDCLDGGFVDPAKPLWLNLGYWRDARTYPDACRAMAELVGERAGLGPGDRVLDVGAGFAEQDFVFLDRFGVSHITAIDITPAHVQRGQDRVTRQRMGDLIDLRLGSATALDFPDASFDRVVALECAFHFDTRDRFFREAYRVLRPGGTVALTDMLPAADRRYGFLAWFGRRYGYWPEANRYGRAEYARRLAATGYVDVDVESIREDVYPGMAQYIQGRVRGRAAIGEVVVDVSDDDRANCRGVRLWERVVGVSDYVIAAARRPSATG
jgi:microcystin synthetase protein McyJ